jgi:hypothetical protein
MIDIVPGLFVPGATPPRASCANIVFAALDFSSIDEPTPLAVDN